MAKKPGYGRLKMQDANKLRSYKAELKEKYPTPTKRPIGEVRADMARDLAGKRAKGK